MSTGDYSEKSYSVLAESLGGEGNAFTSKDHVVFFANISTEDVETVALQLLDNIGSPAITDQVIEREKAIVEAELRSASTDPRDYVYDRWAAAALNGAPFARPTGGTLADVNNLSTDCVVDVYRSRVHSGNVRVIVLGDVDPDRSVELVNDSGLGELAAGVWQPGNTDACVGSAYALDTSGDSASGLTVVMAGGVGPGASDPEGLAAATVADAILGSSPASLLVQRIRHELALAYECQSSYTAYRDLGLWRAMIVVDAAMTGKVYEAVRSVVERAVDRLSTEQVERARREAIGRYLLSRDRWFDRMVWVGDAVWADWTGNVEDEFLGLLRRVDAASIGATLERMFDEGIVFAAAGDVSDTPLQSRLALEGAGAQ